MGSTRQAQDTVRERREPADQPSSRLLAGVRRLRPGGRAHCSGGPWMQDLDMHAPGPASRRPPSPVGSRTWPTHCQPPLGGGVSGTVRHGSPCPSSSCRQPGCLLPSQGCCRVWSCCFCSVRSGSCASSTPAPAPGWPLRVQRVHRGEQPKPWPDDFQIPGMDNRPATGTANVQQHVAHPIRRSSCQASPAQPTYPTAHAQNAAI